MLAAAARSGLIITGPANARNSVRIEQCCGCRAAVRKGARLVEAQASSSSSADGEERRKTEIRRTTRSWRMNSNGGSRAAGLDVHDTIGNCSVFPVILSLFVAGYQRYYGRVQAVGLCSSWWRAEMPDFYAEGEHDLSGFAVGSVKKDALIDGKNIKVGDDRRLSVQRCAFKWLLSCSQVRLTFLTSLVLAKSGATLRDPLPDADVVTIGEALLAPTVIYVRQVLDILSRGGVKGIAHITGGGFTDNIPRVFPSSLGAHVKVGGWDVPPIFKWIQKAGGVEEAEMFRTFNMGIGMVLVVSPEAAEEFVSAMLWRVKA
ncbi:hypothetical protein R1sor_023777 [Riccia sorocarpa]|uniref:phosphoribosylformylglycinamidine cyclo-ligase n=1 Tax=Riccia sorocarpa TaxID=122646 RepID=A0ABD3GQF7_9MARC